MTIVNTEFIPDLLTREPHGDCAARTWQDLVLVLPHDRSERPYIIVRDRYSSTDGTPAGETTVDLATSYGGDAVIDHDAILADLEEGGDLREIIEAWASEADADDLQTLIWRAEDSAAENRYVDQDIWAVDPETWLLAGQTAGECMQYLNLPAAPSAGDVALAVETVEAAAVGEPVHLLGGRQEIINAIWSIVERAQDQ